MYKCIDVQFLPTNLNVKNQSFFVWIHIGATTKFGNLASVCLNRSPLYQSSNLVGTLRLIDSMGLRVERPSSPCSWRIPWYFSRSLAHTHATSIRPCRTCVLGLFMCYRGHLYSCEVIKMCSWSIYIHGDGNMHAMEYFILTYLKAQTNKLTKKKKLIMCKEYQI